MNEGFDDIFNRNSEPEEVEVTDEVEETEVETEVEEEGETPEAETEVTEETPEPTEKTQEEREDNRKGWVPVDAMLEERTKRQQYERELAELKQAQQPRPKSPLAPDPIDDPNGFYDAVTAQAQQIAQQQMVYLKFEWSEQLASEKHGADKVQTVKEWAEQRALTDPAFERAAMGHPNPVEWLVQQHNEHTKLERVRKDEVVLVPRDNEIDFIRQRALELGLIPTNPAPAAEVQKQEASVKAPRSLARVASNTKTTNRTQGSSGFDDLFNLKR